MHCTRDKPGRQADARVEDYDLIIVGAGISGLAATHFYRQRPRPRPASSSWTTTTTSAVARNATNFIYRASFT